MEFDANLFDCFAFLIAIEQGKAKDQIIPTWMVTSPESREEYRKTALQMFAKQAGYYVTSAEAEHMLRRSFAMENQFEQWKAHELQLARDRALGNPTAFFFHTK